MPLQLAPGHRSDKPDCARIAIFADFEGVVVVVVWYGAGRGSARRNPAGMDEVIPAKDGILKPQLVILDAMPPFPRPTLILRPQCKQDAVEDCED